MTTYRFSGVIEADDVHQATHYLLDQLGDMNHIGWASVRPTIREMAHALVHGAPGCKYCGEGPGVHKILAAGPERS
jgi:hypothetical protein